MKIKTIKAILFFFFLLIPAVAPADGTLQGYVSNHLGINVVGAEVSGQGGSVVSDSEGFYSLIHPAGTYSFTASSSGYVSNTLNNISIIDSSATDLDFTLSPMFITTSYPSLGLLDTSLDVEITGGGFDSSTRISLLPDSGNRLNVVGQYTTEDLFAAVSVAIVGTTAYVVDQAGGPLPDEFGMLYIIDVTNPTLPFLLSSLPLPAYGRDVAVKGSYAYVTYGDVDLGTGGLFIIDVNLDNPASPQLKGTVPLNVAYGVTVIGNTAYVVDGNCMPGHNSETNQDFPAGGNLYAINVSDPGVPFIDWSLDTPFSSCALDIEVRNTRAYIANEWEGLKVIDIDSESPAFKQTLNSPALGIIDARGVEVVGPVAFVAAENDGLMIYDVSDSENTSLLGSADTPGYARNVAIINNVAYVADHVSGLSMFDVSDPEAPLPLGMIDSQGASLDVVITGNLAYVANDWAGLGILNVSNPEKPTLIGSMRTVSGAADVLLEADTLYLSSDDGLYVVDVTDPSTPSAGPPIPLNEGTAKRITKANDTVYVAAYSGDLQIIDLTTSNVTSIPLENGTNYSWSVAVDSNFIYVADGDCENGTTGGLNLVDVTDPTNISLHQRIELDGCVTDVVVLNKLAYLTVYDSDTDGLNNNDDNGLKIIDVDPAHLGTFLTEIGTVTTPGGASGLTVSNDHAFVADTWQGLQIINIATPTAPQRVASTGTLGHEARDIKVVGTTAYVADFDSGVYVIDISTVTRPVVIGSVDTPGFAANLAIDGNIAHVADSFSGLTTVSLPFEFTANITEVQEGRIKASLPSPLLQGHYIIRVFHNTLDVNDTLEGAVTFSSTIELLTSKAIIVAGGGPQAVNLWEETKAYANQAYDNLIYQGYRHGDITYITDEPDPLARYGSLTAYANVDPAEKVNLQAAILTWAKGDTGTSDLLIYLVDHGDREEFLLRGGPTPVSITAEEIDSWLDDLQTTLTGKVILVYDACKSGSFVSRMIPPAGKTRITLTSSTPDQVSYFLSDNHSFSSHFWSTFSGKSGNKAVLSEAFQRAASSMRSYQTAQLDANGNGVPNELDDYDTIKGLEGTIYAMRRQYNYKNRSKPVIGTVPVEQTLSGADSVLLQAWNIFDIDNDTIDRVWAEIVAPDFNPDPDGETVTAAMLPTCELSDPDPANGIYEATCSGFAVQGTYLVTYYAEDSSGIYSLPKTSLVVQTSGITPDPLVTADQYEVDNNYSKAQIIIPNDPTPQNHSFHMDGDEDWVQFFGVQGVVYKIKASSPTIISDPIIEVYGPDGRTLKGSSNTAGAGVEEYLNWLCPANGLYYVRLTNNSGHFGTNARYKLQVYNPIAFSLPGYITGRITSGGVGIAGAIIRAGGGTAITLADGSYILYLMPGSYSISMDCSGYESTSFQVTVAGGQHVSIPVVDVNSIPRFINTPASTTLANEPYSYTPVVLEPDGDPVTFSITGKPNWANFSTANGRLWGTPRASDQGTHGPISIRVTDTAGAGDTMVFAIKVLENSGGAIAPIYLLLLH